jgi:hypothetical protein
MKIPGEEPLEFRLVQVGPDGFEDETPMPGAGITVRVRHQIEPLASGRSRVVYRRWAERREARPPDRTSGDGRLSGRPGRPQSTRRASVMGVTRSRETGSSSAEEAARARAESLEPGNSPGFLLWRVSLRWQRLMTATLRPFGLSKAQLVSLRPAQPGQPQRSAGAQPGRIGLGCEG